jgi:hypothetical protein
LGDVSNALECAAAECFKQKKSAIFLLLKQNDEKRTEEGQTLNVQKVSGEV